MFCKRCLYKSWVAALVLVFLLFACKTKKKETPALFQALDSKRTGLNFSNTLSYNQKFNLFKYLYFYNGSGVGAGDFNNDGLVDLFFASSQKQNKLYLRICESTSANNSLAKNGARPANISCSLSRPDR